MTVQYENALAASQGARSHQEDAAAFWPTGESPASEDHHSAPSGPSGDAVESGRLVAVLADGMGGHAGGALASRIVCESFVTGFATALPPIRDKLRAGLDACNRAIGLKVDANPHLNGMGSTLIGATFGPDGLEWVSVGDSPLYFYRRGEIALVNEDHSLAPALDQLAAEGKMTVEAARTDPRRHMLRSAVTGDDLDLVDLSQKPLALLPGDVVVLASDGIHSIDEAEIARLITAYAGDGPSAIAAALIRAVERVRDPHQDNTTVMVVRPKA